MTEQELREKIVEIVINSLWKDAEADYNSTDESEARTIADALIAAGLKFDGEWKRAFELYLKDNPECENCVDRMNGVCSADIEEKADCANRAFRLYKGYAEEELQKERKDD